VATRCPSVIARRNDDRPETGLNSFARGKSIDPMADPLQPIRYLEPVYRPPSEAHSLILPVTDGCSWNRCTFCEMYTAPQKKFRARSEEEVLEMIRRCGETFSGDRVRRVFLADGDALVLPTHRLLRILDAIREYLPSVERVSSYCLARNLKRKSVDDLVQLREAGLQMVYLGAETGDDTVFEKVNKGETFESTRGALLELGEAGITRSVMILNGLGGSRYSEQHADNSARLANETQPEYLATLVVSFPQGEDRFREGFPDYDPLDQPGLFREMRRFIGALELDDTVFRSDHASNWLVLKGRMNRDKDRLLAQLDAAIADPTAAPLRPEWMRGL